MIEILEKLEAKVLALLERLDEREKELEQLRKEVENLRAREQESSEKTIRLANELRMSEARVAELLDALGGEDESDVPTERIFQQEESSVADAEGGLVGTVEDDFTGMEESREETIEMKAGESEEERTV